MALYLLLKVGMLFRFIATGIGGFVYPFTQVKIHCGSVKLILLSCSCSELASLPCSSNCGSGDGCDGWNHWQDHDYPELVSSITLGKIEMWCEMWPTAVLDQYQIKTLCCHGEGWDKRHVS